MATLDEIRAQYYADLAKSGQELIKDLPPLPKETVEGISGAEQQALDLARQSVAQRPDYLSMGVGSLGQASLTRCSCCLLSCLSNGSIRSFFNSSIYESLSTTSD